MTSDAGTGVERGSELHLVQLNCGYDPALTGPDALLDIYHVLTGWGEAPLHQGVGRSTAFQAFHQPAERQRAGICYRFFPGPPVLPRWSAPRRLIASIRDSKPDVVHIHGIIFPGLVWALRRSLPSRVPIVVQDQGGAGPRGPLELGRLARLGHRLAFRSADGFFFSVGALARPWQQLGIIRAGQPVYEIMELSTTMRAVPRDQAQTLTGVSGEPSLLWVGRLNANKDPLTVLDGFERALGALPNARLTMIYQERDLLADVQAKIAASPALTGSVQLVGRIPHDDLAAWYSAADVFVLGSHWEGSGASLIEAVACGLAPVVTDIPSFRAIAADGACWQPGDSAGFAAGLRQACANLPAARSAIREHFDRTLSWNAIGAKAVAAYRELIARRAAFRR